MTPRFERLRPGWSYGLRWKIMLTIAGVACAVAAILGVLVHNVLTRQRVDEIRKEARQSLDVALKEYAYGTETTDGHGAIVDPVELPSPLRKLALGGGRGLMVGEQGGTAVMWAAAPAAAMCSRCPSRTRAPGTICARWTPPSSARRCSRRAV
ncbi:hypothetical protein [Streptomyces sp. NPDC057910]|uniref:hypothetical protein n=1 Tax=Streptomyces sp. NPDC057910 TaxID=3346278 RepID=UPI0036EA624C